MSHIGSFTNIRGGWAYAGLVRKSRQSPKPIKVFIQDGKDDVNNLFGNWPLANNHMAEALKAKGYEYQYLWADQAGHVERGVERQTLTEAMEWVWKTYKGE